MSDLDIDQEWAEFNAQLGEHDDRDDGWPSTLDVMDARWAPRPAGRRDWEPLAAIAAGVIAVGFAVYGIAAIIATVRAHG